MIRAMCYIVKNRRGMLTPLEEAMRYHALLGVAADALEWTEKESDGASKAA